jgi:hypothetical protein
MHIRNGNVVVNLIHTHESVLAVIFGNNPACQKNFQLLARLHTITAPSEHSSKQVQLIGCEVRRSDVRNPARLLSTLLWHDPDDPRFAILRFAR